MNPMAEMLGYKPIDIAKVPADQRADVEQRIRQMDEMGQGPSEAYRKPDGTITVMGFPQSSRSLRRC